MNENWKPVPGFEGRYSVSDKGRVRHEPRARPLKPAKARNGYLRVVLYDLETKRCSYPVHRLVALAFIGAHPTRKEINHDDGNKENNVPGNLEWSTRKLNVQHAIARGLRSRRFSREQVLAIRAECAAPGRGSWVSIALRWKVSESNIRGIHTRKYYPDV